MQWVLILYDRYSTILTSAQWNTQVTSLHRIVSPVKCYMESSLGLYSHRAYGPPFISNKGKETLCLIMLRKYYSSSNIRCYSTNLFIQTSLMNGRYHVHYNHIYGSQFYEYKGGFFNTPVILHASGPYYMFDGLVELKLLTTRFKCFCLIWFSHC